MHHRMDTHAQYELSNENPLNDRQQKGIEEIASSIFALKAVKLSKVELSKEKQAELIFRLWKAHRASNHTTTPQMLSLLQDSMDDGVCVPAAVVNAVKILSCPRCVQTQRRAPSGPQVAMPRAFAPREHIHLDIAHCPIPRFVVLSGRWPSTKAEVMIGTEEFFSFLVGDNFVDSANGDQVVLIYLRSILYEEYPEVTVDFVVMS